LLHVSAARGETFATKPPSKQLRLYPRVSIDISALSGCRRGGSTANHRIDVIYTKGCGPKFPVIFSVQSLTGRWIIRYNVQDNRTIAQNAA